MTRIEGDGTGSTSMATKSRPKLTFDPTVIAPQDVTEESLALARWYDTQPAVRRLWGIRGPRELRVIVMVEPTLDSDDSYPVWFGSAKAWAGELHVSIGGSVQLELIQESRLQTIELDAGSVIIADIYWRDATLG